MIHVKRNLRGTFCCVSIVVKCKRHKQNQKNGLKHSGVLGKIQSSTNIDHDVQQLFLSFCDWHQKGWADVANTGKHRQKQYPRDEGCLEVIVLRIFYFIGWCQIWGVRLKCRQKI